MSRLIVSNHIGSIILKRRKGRQGIRDCVTCPGDERPSDWLDSPKGLSKSIHTPEVISQCLRSGRPHVRWYRNSALDSVLSPAVRLGHAYGLLRNFFSCRGGNLAWETFSLKSRMKSQLVAMWQNNRIRSSWRPPKPYRKEIISWPQLNPESFASILYYYCGEQN